LCVGISYTAMQVRSKSMLDDSLDVFSCHGLAGIGGALLTGVFASKAANPAGGDGLLAGHPGQLGIQLVAVLAAAALAAAGTIVILKVVDVTMGARVGIHDEISGLDLSEHGEEAYVGGDVSGVSGSGIAIGQGVILSH
ncbi:MAG TPA: ammonia channel protein, partial [Gemmatimonadales bacterium]|nr:ammonia channel protein [Gemmatimonadales bacterium]